jgi:hypothetical protein
MLAPIFATVGLFRPRWLTVSNGQEHGGIKFGKSTFKRHAHPLFRSCLLYNLSPFTAAVVSMSLLRHTPPTHRRLRSRP